MLFWNFPQCNSPQKGKKGAQERKITNKKIKDVQNMDHFPQSSILLVSFIFLYLKPLSQCYSSVSYGKVQVMQQETEILTIIIEPFHHFLFIFSFF